MGPAIHGERAEQIDKSMQRHIRQSQHGSDLSGVQHHHRLSVPTIAASAHALLHSKGSQTVKPAANNKELYPSTTSHQVMPVTRGEHLACFMWMQSMVRDTAQRLVCTCFFCLVLLFVL